MSLYYNTNVEHPSPESLPFGQDDLYDWDRLNDEQLRERGWVKFDPPKHDVNFETPVPEFSKDDNGLAVVTYTLASLPVYDYLFTLLKGQIADRRWREETGGVTVTGISFVIPTTAEAIAKIDSLLGSFYDEYVKEKSKIDFNIGENTVSLDLAGLENIKQVIVEHTQACHSKQAKMYNKLEELATDENSDAVTLRDYVYTELETKWSKYAAYIKDAEEKVMVTFDDSETPIVYEDTVNKLAPLFLDEEGQLPNEVVLEGIE